MLIAGIVVICIVLFLLALVAPRLARKPHAALGTGAAAASHAPGVFGRWLPKPFRNSQKATSKSTAAGGKAHRKITEKL